MRIIGILGLMAAAAGAAHADCRFTAQREAALDLAGVTRVVVTASQGDLHIAASADARRIVAKGTACASTQQLLDNLRLEMRREEDGVVYINAGARGDAKVIVIGSAYSYLDVGIALPPGLPVEVRDSSGDAEVHGVSNLVLDDSSGDIRLRDIGSAEIKDGSGDISVIGARGDVTVTFDGSGDISIENIDGHVEIGSDGSGDIRISRVKGNVAIGADGSGDIIARDVGGDFTLGTDGDGDVLTTRIAGKVSVP